MAKTAMKIKQQRKPKFSTRAYTRCKLCGRPHSVLKKYGIKNYYIDYLSGTEFDNFLSNIEYGFCLRKDISVNNVSTPTKLSSYVCNGVIPIVTESIIDFCNLFHNSNYSIVLNSNLDFDVSLIKKRDSNVYRDFKALFGNYYMDSYYVKLIAKKIGDLL